MKFNIYLLCIIAFFSMLGTFIPQSNMAPVDVEAIKLKYPQLFNLMDFFGFFNIYQTPVFILLLAYVAINISICRIFTSPFDIKYLKSKFYSSNFDELKLKENGFKVRGNTAYSGIINRIAIQFLHLSIVLVLLWGLAKAIIGFEGFLVITENTSEVLASSVKKKFLNIKKEVLDNTVIKLEKFLVEFYDNSQTPKRFLSIIKISGNEGTRLYHLEVNKPCFIKGIKLYQASWGVAPMVKRAEVLIDGRVYSVDRDIKHSGFTFKFTGFYPDFSIDSKGQLINTSFEPENPALYFTVFDRNSFIADLVVPFSGHTLWRFRNSNWQVGPEIKILRFEPILFSGIAVNYDPAIFLVYIALFTGVPSIIVAFTTKFYLVRKTEKGVVVFTNSNFAESDRIFL